MSTQHMQVKVQNDNNNDKLPKAEKIFYTKKQAFFKNWSYVCAAFGTITFLLNFFVLFMIPQVDAKHDVWMGFHSFSLINFDPDHITFSMTTSGILCIAFNVIWTIAIIVQLVGNYFNGVKLYAPYVQYDSIILLVASYFVMILGLTANPMHSESSCMFAYNAKDMNYSFTSIGFVILIEFIIFLLILIGKVVWYHIPSEKKEWLLNTKIVKRMNQKQKNKKG